MSCPLLDKAAAERIARKLKAEIREGSAHTVAVVLHDGIRIASFGIRRSSKKNQGHDHIPNDLHCAAHFAMDLARCHKSLDDWLDHLRQKNLI